MTTIWGGSVFRIIDTRLDSLLRDDDSRLPRSDDTIGTDEIEREAGKQPARSASDRNVSKPIVIISGEEGSEDVDAADRLSDIEATGSVDLGADRVRKDSDPAPDDMDEEDASIESAIQDGTNPEDNGLQALFDDEAVENNDSEEAPDSEGDYIDDGSGNDDNADKGQSGDEDSYPGDDIYDKVDGWDIPAESSVRGDLPANLCSPMKRRLSYTARFYRRRHCQRSGSCTIFAVVRGFVVVEGHDLILISFHCIGLGSV